MVFGVVLLGDFQPPRPSYSFILTGLGSQLWFISYDFYLNFSLFPLVSNLTFIVFSAFISADLIVKPLCYIFYFVL